MASIGKATRGYRAAGALVCAGSVALLAAGQAAAQRWQDVDVYEAPSIAGTAQVGATLTAQGGAWSGPPGTQAGYRWWRCPTPSSVQGCGEVSENASQYTLVAADQGQYMFVVLYARHGGDADYEVSTPTAQVAAPPTPAATPTPVPTFEATPVPNLGAVLDASAKNRRILRPFPIVRMRGRLTLLGARVTLFSVRAPRHVRIAVSCTGTGCPHKRWQRTTGRRRLTRIGAFESRLVYGVRITVVVSRRGYIGKRTVFRIRRGQAPLRLDGCITSAGRRIRCPAGVR